MKIRCLRVKSLALISFVLVSIFFLVGPFVTGFLFEKNYKKLLNEYNAGGEVRVTLDEFERGWFRSRAKVTVEIVRPDFFKELGFSSGSANYFPTTYQLEQDITHGPIIYFSHRFFFSEAVIKNSFLKSNVTYHSQQLAVQLGELKSYFWILPNQSRVSGDLVFDKLTLTDESGSIFIPDAALHFDFKKNEFGAFVLKDALRISTITLRDTSGSVISIFDTQFNGSLEEVSGFLRGERKFEIGKFEFDNQIAGPLVLKFGVSDINSTALFDAISAYRNIMRTGELYESQLQYKLSLILPKVMRSTSRFFIEKLTIQTPKGTFEARADVSWLQDESSFPDKLHDIVKAANVQASVKLSKPLADTLINFAAVLPYFNEPSEDDQRAYWAVSDDAQMAVQRNAVSLLSLAQNGFLSEQDALTLLSLQEKTIPMADYGAVIKNLFLAKTISRETSYYLYWQYAAVRSSISVLREVLERYRDKRIENARAELRLWLDKGYIKQNKTDYISSIVRSQDEIKLNGYLFKP